MIGAYIYSMQIQEVNEKYEHYSMECKALKQQKIQVLDKLENLDGIPEKYRKQVLETNCDWGSGRCYFASEINLKLNLYFSTTMYE
jgi:hypothetical protein